MARRVAEGVDQSRVAHRRRGTRLFVLSKEVENDNCQEKAKSYPYERSGRREKQSMKEKGPIYPMYLGLAVLVIVAVSYSMPRQPTEKPAAPTEDGRKHPGDPALLSKEW